MRLTIQFRGGTSLLYQGFQHYIQERTKHLDTVERKRLLACFLLEFGLPLFESYIRDRKEKLPGYQVHLVRHAFGDLGVVSIVRGPIFIARNLPVGEALRLFKVSYCMRNFRAPLSLYAKVLSYEALAGLLAARHANRLLNSYEILLNLERSVRARLYFKLFMRSVPQEYPDPLSVGLERCLAAYSRKRTRWYLTVDLYNYLEEAEAQTVYADAEKRQSLLLDPAPNCPLKAFTVIDLDNGFVAHSADIA